MDEDEKKRGHFKVIKSKDEIIIDKGTEKYVKGIKYDKKKAIKDGKTRKSLNEDSI